MKIMIMNIDELKGRLHESIENINDDEFLLTIKDLIERKYQSSDNPKLSDWQLNRIKESENQIETNNSYSNEQVDTILDRWLEE